MPTNLEAIPEMQERTVVKMTNQGKGPLEGKKRGHHCLGMQGTTRGKGPEMGSALGEALLLRMNTIQSAKLTQSLEDLTWEARQGMLKGTTIGRQKIHLWPVTW